MKQECWSFSSWREARSITSGAGMAGVDATDPAGEVDEDVAVDVDKLRATACARSKKRPWRGSEIAFET